MAAYPPFYQHAQPHFFNQLAFDAAQPDFQRPKTPTDSIINHSGLSPHALFTTPPISRHSSQPPELPQDQPPDYMHWDHASLSNSPTSVRTPDQDSFEVELDPSEAMYNYYHGNSISTQGSQNPGPVTDMFLAPHDIISDQGMFWFSIRPFSLTSRSCQCSLPSRLDTAIPTVAAFRPKHPVHAANANRFCW
jgi:hypothetical protein